MRYRYKLFIALSIIFGFTACQDDEQMNIPECSLEPDPGLCLAAFPRYYWDEEACECKEFTWGGCGGVVPFETLEACEVCSCF